MEAYSVNPIDSYRFKVLECSSQCLHMSKYIMIIYQYIYIYVYVCIYIYINLYIYIHAVSRGWAVGLEPRKDHQKEAWKDGFVLCRSVQTLTPYRGS